MIAGAKGIAGASGGACSCTVAEASCSGVGVSAPVSAAGGTAASVTSRAEKFSSSSCSGVASTSRLFSYCASAGACSARPASCVSAAANGVGEASWSVALARASNTMPQWPQRTMPSRTASCSAVARKEVRQSGQRVITAVFPTGIPSLLLRRPVRNRTRARRPRSLHRPGEPIPRTARCGCRFARATPAWERAL